MKNKDVANAIRAGAVRERDYSQKDRDAMDDSDFGDPENQAFPIKVPEDVIHAAERLHNSKGDQVAIKARIKRIAKRKGFPLPDTWRGEDTPKESATPATFQPKQRIARIKSYFLEDDAISLNGRQYPKEAVDKLIQSAQVQLSDPNALPLTCYLSHDEADKDNLRALTGRITDVGREGKKAYAWIDIPDTTAGRDAATLIKGGYVLTQSLRASGAEMYREQGWNYPLVGGSALKLEGIDFTTTPGLPQVARIADITESAPQAVQEIFTTHPSSLLLEGEDMKEEYIHPTTSGDSPSTDGTPRGDYPYSVPAVQQAGNADIDREIHDHIASAMGMSCAPGSMESARSIALLTDIGLITEAGAKFSANTKGHLMQAHDKLAQKLGMECSSDGMQDGDDDDKPAEKEAKNPMTREEAARILQEAGYTVAPPKTAEEKLQEKLDAMQAAFDAKLAALTQGSQRPQRRSLVEGANVQEGPKRPYYRHGDYLREQLRGMNREELLDRSRPLPEWMDPERALAEFQKELLGMYDARYPLD